MGRLNQFLFRNRILFLYFLYIYICMYVLFRQEGKILITFHFERNSSFFSKNGTKFGRKKSFRLNSRLFVVEQKIRAKSIQLLSRASCSRLKLLEIGREFFSFKTRLYFNRPIKRLVENNSDSSYLRVVRQQHPHSAQLFFQQKLLLPVSLRLRQIAPASLQFVPETA